MAELAAERGGDPDRPGKKDPLDPVVWLTARPGEPAWPSELGPGRPGWHVECAAIATHYLGSVFDVQAGGTDLIFPHHEMSASHARVALGAAGAGEAFARRYAHAGMVRLNGEKMSKSLGNLVLVSKLRAAGVDPMAIRLAILAKHYRRDWDWTDDGLAAAADRLARWRAAVALAGEPVSAHPGTAAPQPGAGPAGRGRSGGGSAAGHPPPPGRAAPARPGNGPAAGVPSGRQMLAAVRERLADDLDAPGALAAVDRWAAAVAASGAADGGAADGGAADGVGRGGPDAAPGLVRDTIDALLGIAL
jgi:L-cysteine:1D-myo-inositol 2-amino-2-deoxy-alpha-D-glucopyranoside ligase